MELLKELYKTYSPSGNEKRMRKFISSWVKSNVPEATIKRDELGNLYITKGTCATYPCVCAHIDQVQKIHSKDFNCYVADGIIFGYSKTNKRQEGLGADDKNGIWVALKCLERFDVIKCAFFVGEELGCVGSDKADMTFFENCRFVLQCDRRNGDDLITSIGGWTQLCSTEFLADIDYAKFGYKEESGMMTDVEALKNHGLSVCALNISCGYYSPHTDHEVTIFSELENCLHFVEHIIEKCDRVYPHMDFELSYAQDYELEEEKMDVESIIETHLHYYPTATKEEVMRSLDGMYFYLSHDEVVDIIDEVKKRMYATDNAI